MLNDGGAVLVQTGGGLSRFGSRESLGPAMSEVRLIGNGALLNPQSRYPVSASPELFSSLSELLL